MSNMHLELLGIIAATTLACVLPGTFLLLRGVALMSDAISHAILPGIVIMFMLIKHLHSPLLILGACLAGIATVVLTEAIIQTQRLKKDTAIGLVFPLFFSIGVILISSYARSIHLDMDSVILGHLIFAPFTRLIIYGVDYGAQALWIMSCIALLNAFLTYALLKELTITTFDPTLSSILGFRPRMVYYALMIMTSITCVCAFDVVGAIVVVALMIVPSSAAFLLVRSVSEMVLLACIFGFYTTWGGFLIAHAYDVSIAGSIATASGLIFIVALLIYRLYLHYATAHSSTIHDDLEITLLCSWLIENKGIPTTSMLAHSLGWSTQHTKRIIQRAHAAGLVEPISLAITHKGHIHTSYRAVRGG